MVSKKHGNIIELAAAALLIVVIIFGLYILKDVLIPLLISGLIAILVLPIVSFLESKKFPRVLAITLTILLVFTILTLVIILFVNQIASLDNVWPLMIDKGEEWIKLGRIFITENLHVQQAEQLTEGKKYLSELLKNSSSFFSNALSTTTGFLANFSLIPLYIFLMLLYRDFLREFLYRAFYSKSRYHIDLVVHKIEKVVQNYLSGLLLVILIIGILNSTALLVLGIPNAIFFGFFAALLVLLPYIGVAIGSLLPIIMALITKDSAWYAVGVAGSFAVVQFLEGNFITPYIVGSKVSINSLAAILALILFGNLWGISGLVLALPLTAIIKVIFDSSKRLKPFGYLLGGVEE